jgi:Mg2+-importing ATPase
MNVFSRPDGFAQPVRAGRHASDDHLFALSRLSPAETCAGVGSTPEGLTASEAESRLREYGLNLVTRERRVTIPQEL